MSAGTLFVVATPIGNLEDITLRALRVLREADVIAAEDTRRTARLLAAHGIPTPTLSFHEHNTRSRIPRLLERLRAGQRVALVTDAGTPGVSDPGIELVQACIDAGITIDPVPGASAPLAAAVASGFPLDPLTILGFPPRRSHDRTAWFTSLKAVHSTVVFFEAPHRIARTLQEMAAELGERPIMVGREITKMHQEFLRGTASALAERLPDPRGEFTIVVGPSQHIDSKDIAVTDPVLAGEFGHLTDVEGLSRRSAISTLARKYGRPARDVYAAIEREKGPGE